MVALSTLLQKQRVIESKLELPFRDIESIGEVSPCNTAQLDLSYNKLSSLQGIEAFRQLTHLNVSHNNIQHIEEFEYIVKKENLVFLSIKGNPISRHPNIIALLIDVFPRLAELDGEPINEATRIDIHDSLQMTKTLLPYFYENEKLMVKLNADIQFMRLKHDIVATGLNRLPSHMHPMVSELNAQDMLRAQEYSLLIDIPNYEKIRRIRPFMLTEFMKVIKEQLPEDPQVLEEETVCRIYKWLYCEILLHLHKTGYHDLQCFLQTQNALEGSIVSDLLVFSSLTPHPGALTEFPVFGCNSEYLRALYSVLYKQALAIQAMIKERCRVFSSGIRSQNETLSIDKGPADLLQLMHESADSIISPPRKGTQPAAPAQIKVNTRFSSPSFPEGEYISPSNRLKPPTDKLHEFPSPHFPNEPKDHRLAIPGKFEEGSRLEFESCDLNLSNSKEDLSFSIDDLENEERIWKKHLLQKLLDAWRRYTQKMNAHRLKVAAYYRQRLLKKKAVAAIKCNSREQSITAVKASKESAITQVIERMNTNPGERLNPQKLQKQHTNKRLKRLLLKILREWLYLVRPSARYARKKEPPQRSDVERLLAKISQKKRSISSQFKTLRSKCVK